MSLFMPLLKTSGHLDRVYMTISNVGSRKHSDSAKHDYATKGWGVFAPNLTIIGFDADPEACAIANADIEARDVNWMEVHMPLALGKEKAKQKLYLTSDPECSSLYPPNADLIDRFAGLPEMVTLVDTEEVSVTTLDNFCESESIDAIDFLQVDVQGADLDVLIGGEKILSTVMGIQIEVEFAPIYQQQPLFGDVDTFLRQHGFTMYSIAAARRSRRLSPIMSNSHPGQVLWGDAFYIRDLLSPEVPDAQKTPEAIFKLACVSDVMQFYDYTLELLAYLTKHYGSDPNYNFANQIIEVLRQFPNLQEQKLGGLPIMAEIKDHVSGEYTNFL
ncbi:methyltransferase FkbM family [Thalassoporum mexicanum PCC 7367]|uniref:FkbM family methyltransferase n=1 Tax=Thalassoporum mexicanum TaxID=3457544 RepID=UPI00029FA327|nr:FkbM family methyltransferase [Pseudanabaena sp. PCC 7367]AFY69531.1 methyltransferase FkbM family [Pseudanabaena sp. PCC 7367]